MFDIGFLEILLIGVVGLLVLGPERLPMAARTAGMWIGRIKRSVSGIQREINEQLRTEEVRQKVNEHKKSFSEGVSRVNREVESIADDDRSQTSADSSSDRSDTREASSSTPEQRLDDAVNRARQPASDTENSGSAKHSQGRVYVANSRPTGDASTEASSNPSATDKDPDSQ